MSVSLMVASLLQKFKFEPIKPQTPLIPVQYDITMNFNATNGLHMLVTPRQQQQQQQQFAARAELSAATAAAVSAR